MRCALVAIALAALGGCGPADPSGGRSDASPITLKKPPGSKDGNSSAPACDGVPARGECQAGAAVYCDLEREELRRVDCRALGRQCVMDPGRGAVCESISAPGGGSGGACNNGVDYAGFCTGDTAIWCDEEEAATYAWHCPSSGLSCQTDACADGAYCCGGGGGGSCGGLDFYGECGGPGGQTARWCGADGLHEIDCAAQGKSCQLDACATGAFCCGARNECDALGILGECTAAGNVRFCLDGDIIELPCGSGTSCQVGVCFAGAECCADAPPAQCGPIGVEGVCEGDTLRYCQSGQLVEQSCSAQGKTCQVDACSPGWAECC
jgi:hypothetical protein